MQRKQKQLPLSLRRQISKQYTKYSVFEGLSTGDRRVTSSINKTGDYSLRTILPTFTMEFYRSTLSLKLIIAVAALQLLGSYVQRTTAEPRIQVSVVTNPLEEDGTAIIECRVWDNPDGEIVVVEYQRLPSRRPETILWNGQFDDSIGDNFYTSRRVESDGSFTQSLTIRYVYRFDAGTYICKMGRGVPNGEFSETTSGSAYLDILHYPSDIYPTCEIVGSDKTLSRTSGSDLSLGCTTEFGSPRVGVTWSRTGNGYIPPPQEISNGAIYSQIQITLTQADNGVTFTCNARIPDSNDGYSSSCVIGPIQVTTGGVPPRPPTLPPNNIPTQAPPTPEPNTGVEISSPGSPFQEDEVDTVSCQVWELASNYVLAMSRTTPSGTETLVYNEALLENVGNNFQFDTTPQQNDNSIIFTLTITSVHRSDAGTYSCSVYRPTGENTYDIKASDSTIVEVINRATTEPPVAATVSLTIPSPVQAGNRAYVQCSVTGVIGKDELVISIESVTAAGLGTLAHDGQLSLTASRANNIFLVVQDDSVLDGTISYFMTINSVRQIDSGSYTCLARRSSGSEAVIAIDTKDLTVTFATQPVNPSETQAPNVNPITLPVETRVSLSAQADFVEEDNQAVLICQVWGLESSQVVNIERETHRGTEVIVENNNLKDSVRDYVYLTLRGQTDGSLIYYLTFRFVEARETGEYTCNVKQIIGASSFLIVASDSYYLNVIVPTLPPPTAPPRATVPPTGTRAIVTISAEPAPEGSTVYFQCQIYEMFPNHIVAIKRSTARGSETLVYNDEIPFSVADNFFVSVLPQTDGSVIYYLIIRDIHRSDTGTYSCSIYNTFGSVSQNIVTMGSVELDVAYLPVKGHPKCQLTSSTNQTSLKYRDGDDINLVCSSGFGKPRVGVHWRSDKDTNKPERGEFKIVDDMVYSELGIQLSRDRHHDATFTCAITSTAYEDTDRTCTIGPLSVSSASSIVMRGLLHNVVFVVVVRVLNTLL